MIGMATINELMDDSVRQVIGKVEITYSDGTVDASITASSMDTGRNTFTNNLYDGATSNNVNWFSLHDNKLDGTYKILPTVPDARVGWWSNNISEVDGHFIPCTLR